MGPTWSTWVRLDPYDGLDHHSGLGWINPSTQPNSIPAHAYDQPSDKSSRKERLPMALLWDNAHFLFSGLGLMDSNGLRVHNLFNYSTVKT